MEFDLPELLLDLFFDPSKFLSSNENWANFLLLSHTYQKICGPNMNGVERTKAKFYKMLKVQFVLRLSSLRSRVPNAIWFFWKNKMFWPSAFMAFIVHKPLFDLHGYCGRNQKRHVGVSLRKVIISRPPLNRFLRHFAKRKISFFLRNFGNHPTKVSLEFKLQSLNFKYIYSCLKCS